MFGSATAGGGAPAGTKGASPCSFKRNANGLQRRPMRPNGALPEGGGAGKNAVRDCILTEKACIAGDGRVQAHIGYTDGLIVLALSHPRWGNDRVDQITVQIDRVLGREVWA